MIQLDYRRLKERRDEQVAFWFFLPMCIMFSLLSGFVLALAIWFLNHGMK